MKTIDQILNQTHAIFKIENDLRCFYKLSEGYIYTSSKKINLINSKTEILNFQLLKSEFLKFKIENSCGETGKVFNLNYELGHLFDCEEFRFKDEVVLGYYLHFEESFILDTSAILSSHVDVEVSSGIGFREYEEKFNKVYDHLLSGDCYQLNLTSLFELSFSGSRENLYKNFLKIKKLSEFAHAIFIKEVDLLLLSNSPECLFEICDEYLYSRPIKGTISNRLPADDLLNDKKNNTELNIVTDLMRNDLSKIGESFSAVESARKIFSVPGLHHLCSVIKVKIDIKSMTLFEILRALFPGGSISGAPKKRVLSIISKIEDSKRGFYTGSTVLFYNDLKKASINIRTAKIEGPAQKMIYGAGGGITLLSDCVGEYEEVGQKVSSFLSLFLYK